MVSERLQYVVAQEFKDALKRDEEAQRLRLKAMDMLRQSRDLYDGVLTSIGVVKELGLWNQNFIGSMVDFYNPHLIEPDQLENRVREHRDDVDRRITLDDAKPLDAQERKPGREFI